MGMYTELILGAELKKDTPEHVIGVLKYILGETEEKPDNFPLSEGRCEWLLRGTSCSFGVSTPVNKLIFDDVIGYWIISSRSNIKNYGGEIEEFLNWLKPYISGGSGARDFYAITIYEEAESPTIHYLID